LSGPTPTSKQLDEDEHDLKPGVHPVGVKSPTHVWAAIEEIVLDPATGAIIASVVHDDGSELDRDEIGPSVFVGDQLVIASELGITYYDIVR
jgi:hypothetical protein